MTWRRFLGVQRQPDQWPSAHERARVRAAERLDWSLEADEAAWLEEHLRGCPTCTALAAEYESQRTELRGLRGQEPVPPRELWARTAAAIESDSGRRRRMPATSRGRPIGLPVGAISGVLVVAVVVGASLLSQGTQLFVPSTAPTIGSGGPLFTPTPGATPLSVPADDVAWVRIDQSGDADVVSAAIDQVCPDGRSDCAPIDGSSTRTLKLAQAPVAVVRSPGRGELIVVDRPAGATGATVYAVPAPTPTSHPTTSPAAPSSAPATPVPTPTQQPTPSIEATPTPTPTSGQTSPPTASTEPSPSPSPTATASPALPVEGAIAIASDVVLVGDSAAYSPDGRWFAFSARPADGSAGPDIFVWRSGDDVARPLTTDHRTVFASWLGSQILASRAVVDDAGGEGDPDASPDPSDASATQPPATAEPSESAEPAGSGDAVQNDEAVTGIESEVVTIDPDTGLETGVTTGAWRPTVRPGEDAAIYWEGTLEADAAGAVLRPSRGRLVLSHWPIGSGSREPQVLAPDRIVDWDARWDVTGTRLAVWIADDVDPELGTLSLYVVDLENGRLDRRARPLVDVPARRGFSIAPGRLAWVSPPGQDGEGSRVQVLGWTDEGFGKVETLPGHETIVVIR